MKFRTTIEFAADSLSDELASILLPRSISLTSSSTEIQGCPSARRRLLGETQRKAAYPLGQFGAVHSGYLMTLTNLSVGPFHARPWPKF
jgi:hypothetical protein